MMAISKLWTNRHRWGPQRKDDLWHGCGWSLKRRIIDMHRTKIQHIQTAPRHIDHPDKDPAQAARSIYTDPTPEPLDAPRPMPSSCKPSIEPYCR